MKTDIHPRFFNATVTCSCGHTFQTGATKPQLRVEICSKCHPFYTGEQRIVDTQGRIERFKPPFSTGDNAVGNENRGFPTLDFILGQ